MRTTKVTYGRIKNLGNYENERMDVEVELNETDTVASAILMAKRLVYNHLGLAPDESEVVSAKQAIAKSREILELADEDIPL